jgi:hypothetical protein
VGATPGPAPDLPSAQFMTGHVISSPRFNLPVCHFLQPVKIMSPPSSRLVIVVMFIETSLMAHLLCTFH